MRMVRILLMLTLAVTAPGARAAEAATNVMTTISAAHRLKKTQIGKGRPFEFKGQVLAKFADMMVLRDASAAEVLFDEHASERDYAEGDYVRVTGIVLDNRNFFARSLQVESVEIEGHGALPTAVDLPVINIHFAENSFQFARIHGVLDSVTTKGLGDDWYWATLRTQTIKIGLGLPTSRFKAADLLALVNAEISVRGLISRAKGTPHSLPVLFGVHLVPRSMDDIKVLKPVPADPFSAPPLGDADRRFRNRLSGTVEAAGAEMFVLRADNAAKYLVFPAEGVPAPHYGDRVTVAGFAAPQPDFLTFENALVRTDEPGSVTPSAAPTQLEDALREPAFHQLATVSARGRVATVMQNGKSTSEITIVNPKFTVTADLSAITDALRDIPEPGDEVEVTGAVISEDEQPTSNAPVPRLRTRLSQLRRHRILLRAPGDFVLLSRRSKWSQARVMTIVGSLVGVIILFFILSYTLRRTVERRSKALFNEHSARIRAETKIDERTHLSVELHDSLSQTLTGVALQIEAASRAVRDGNTGAVSRFLDLGTKMLSSCRKELQSCLWEMRTRTFAEKDMTEAIRKTIEPYVQDVSVRIRFNVPRERFSELSTHAVLKIVRELVANAVRHGKASAIRIAGESHGDIVSFSVRDNGCGFDPETAAGPTRGHFGLHGIRERLKSFSGTIVTVSAPGKGTDIKISMTVKAPTDNE